MADPLPREFYRRPALDVAPALLGQLLLSESPDGVVAVSLTEVEAYEGASDPASHAFRGRTPRNAVMFGPGGHAYVYFTYGMHFCVNLVCGEEGTASAVLLRAGRVIEGEALALARRGRGPARDLARGPARLCQALGITRAMDGTDVCAPRGALRVMPAPEADGTAVTAGPRVGVSSAGDWPWRFWLSADPTVSVYRRHTPRRRAARPPTGLTPG